MYSIYVLKIFTTYVLIVYNLLLIFEENKEIEWTSYLMI